MVYKRSGKDAAIDIGVYGGSTLAVPIVSKRWLDMPFCDMVGMATKFIDDLVTGKWDKVSAAECGVTLGAGQFDTAALTSKEVGDRILKGEEALMRNPDGECVYLSRAEYEQWLTESGKFRGLGALKLSNSLRLAMGTLKVTDAIWNYITDKHDVAAVVTGTVDLVGGGLGLFNLNPGHKAWPLRGRPAVIRRYRYKPQAAAMEAAAPAAPAIG